MYATLGEKSLEITLSKGVVFRTTPSLLISAPEYRILPFSMIKEQKGNWKEVKEWFKKVLGCDISFYDKTPIDIKKESELIERFEFYGQRPWKTFSKSPRNTKGNWSSKDEEVEKDE